MRRRVRGLTADARALRLVSPWCRSPGNGCVRSTRPANRHKMRPDLDERLKSVDPPGANGQIPAKVEGPMRPATTQFDAWNPGLESELPREYFPLSTVFRGENVSTGIAKAHELSEYCGLPAHELVAF